MPVLSAGEAAEAVRVERVSEGSNLISHHRVDLILVWHRLKRYDGVSSL